MDRFMRESGGTDSSMARANGRVQLETITLVNGSMADSKGRAPTSSKVTPSPTQATCTQGNSKTS